MTFGLKVSSALVQSDLPAFVLAKRQTSARGDISESVRPLRGYLGGIANNLNIHIPAPLAGTQGIEKKQICSRTPCDGPHGEMCHGC
jgi:AAA+ superfamily predicted ATPase